MILKFLFILATAFLLLGISLAGSPVIVSVSTSYLRDNYVKEGSFEGGTLVYIKGNGFDFNKLNDLVRIGSLECPIIEANSIFITCRTPPGTLDGQAQKVRVFVNGVEATCMSTCEFTFKSAKSPALYYLWPRTTNPGQYIYFYGIFKVGGTEKITIFKLADSLCDRFDLGDDSLNGYAFNSIQCRVSPRMHGGLYYAQTRSDEVGDPTKMPFFMTYSINGDPYEFACIPNIQSVSSNKGAIKGQIITIKGSGFSNIPAEVAVKADELACDIISTDIDMITCRVQEDTRVSRPTFNVGQSGLVREVYDLTGFSIWAATLKTTLETFKEGDAKRPPLMTRDIIFEAGTYPAGDYYGQAIKGYFRAPKTGNYRFFVASDDSSQVWLSTTSESSDRTKLTLVAYLNGWTSFRRYISVTSQISAPISLEAGHYYLLEAYHVEGGGGDHFSLAVEVPNNDEQPNNIYEVNSININYQPVFEEVDMRIWGATGGVFKVTVGDRTTREISWGASAGDFEYVVNNDLAYYAASVTRKKLDGNGVTIDTGTESGYSYLIKYLRYRPKQDLPFVDVSKLSGSPKISKTQSKAPSPAIGGTFTVSYNTIVSADIPYNDDGSQLYKVLTTTFSFSKEIVVQIQGYAEGENGNGRGFTIFFYKTKGDVPDFTFDVSKLTGGPVGTPPTMTLTELVKGSNNLFFDPIPFDMLFTQVSKPQVVVSVNKVLGSCNPSSDCSYEIDVTKCVTPEVQSFSVTSDGLTISITNPGSLILRAEEISIEFAKNVCTQIVINSLQITCSVEKNLDGTLKLEAGDFKPLVHILNIGFANYADSVNNHIVPLAITSINPNTGGDLGGTIVEITGTGFSLSKSSPNIMQVLVSSAIWEIISVTNTKVTLRTTKKNGVADLTINLNQKSATSNLFSYSSSGIPSISSISPATSSPVQKADLTISGINFGNDKTKIKCYLDQGNILNVYELSVFSVSDTSIVCILGGGHTGSYKVRIVKDPIGASTAASESANVFNYQFTVDSISPSSGSRYGGTLLTITGSNFSPVSNQNQIFIGPDNILCDVKSASATTLTCLTRAAPDNYSGQLVVVIQQRLSEDGVCTSTCVFEYLSAANSPEVTAATISDTGEQVSGDLITITGTNLSPSTAVTTKIIFQPGNQATLDAATNSATEITFNFPSLKPGLSIFQVLIDNIGFAKVPTSLIYTTNLKFTSVSPTTGSLGGAVLTVSGNGFNEKTSIAFSDSTLGACKIITTSPTTITCRAPKSVNHDVKVIDSTTLTCVGCFYHGDTTKTPYVTAISPTTVTPISDKFSLSFTGTGFTLNTITETALEILDPVTSNVLKYQGSVSSSTSSLIVAEFTSVPAGTSYNISILFNNIGYAFFNVANTVKVNLPLPTAASVVSSFNGGVKLTLAGLGFISNSNFMNSNRVTICGTTCPITSNTYSSLECEVPPLITTLSDSTYSLANTDLVTFNAFNDLNVADKALNDDNTATLYYCKTGNCFVKLSFGDTQYALIEYIKFYPDILTTVTLFVGLTFEGSNDDLTYTLIKTMKVQDLIAGWNYVYPDSIVSYKYIRIKAGSSTSAKVRLGEVQIIGKKYQDSTAALSSISCEAKISINGVSQIISNAVEYRSDVTPTFTNISPQYGSTLGNTDITITGTGFGTVKGAVSVLIDGIACVVATVTDISIVCKTGARPTFVPPSLDIRINTNKAANLGATYLYIDRWSEPNTWGGEQPPREGESAYIPSGQVLLVDVSTPILYSVIIEGGIVFEDVKDLEFNANIIICHMCFFQIGTETVPHTHKLTITLYGKKSDKQLPVYGNKGLIIHHGHLDIHGVVRTPTWTLLATTASKGVSTITIQDAVDWKVGEQIVIATTDWSLLQSETRYITQVSVDQKTLTLDRPLDFTHISVRDEYGPNNEYFMEMRAEVALLTRNVVFRGDDLSQQNLYGAHMMIHGNELEGTRARISYAEFYNTGQQTIIGRYPIHFHLCGEMHSSYVLGNAVHHSLARLVTVHGSRFLRIQKNVGFDIFGHQFFLEDGAETNNIIEDNLAINTKMVWTLIDTDVTASAYWLTHPYNILRRNRAAGGEWYGFWYELRPNPTGPSVNPNICPEGELLGEFTDNESHSFLRYGLRVKTHWPRTFPCNPAINLDVQDPYKDNPSVLVVYKNFITWKNGENGVQFEDYGHIWLENMKIADSKEGAIDIWVANVTYEGAAKIRNIMIVGISTGNPGEPADYTKSRGIILPRSNYFNVENVVFINFNQQEMTALAACSMCWHVKKKITGGKTTKLKNLKFVNVVNKVFWDGVKRDIFVDLDGSLTGLTASNAPYYLSPYNPHLLDTANGCKRDDTETKVFGDAVICPKSAPMREILFFLPAPGTLFTGVQMKILRITSTMDLTKATPADFTIADQVVVKSGDCTQSWGFPFVIGNTYNLHWGYGIDFSFVPLRASSEWLPDEKILLRFNYTLKREVFDVLVKTGTTLNNITQTASGLQLSNTLQYGANYIDQNSKQLFVGVSGSINGSMGITPVLCRLTCPKVPSTEAPKEDTVRLWSNASMWPGARLPLQGESVVILDEWQVVLDVDPPALGELRINGILQFDPARDISKLSASTIYIYRGRLVAGNETNPFPKKIEITLTGRKESPELQIDQYTEPGNKVLAVTGKLLLFGMEKKVPFARLFKFAKKGSLQIEVENSVEGDWFSSDKIVIGPSDFKYDEYEIISIAGVSGNKITLSTPLKYDHYGDTKVIETHVGKLDMRAVVGLLSRNIVIQGSDEGGWGCNILACKTVEKVGDFNIDRNGEIQFRGVEVRGCGQTNSVRAAVHFENSPGFLVNNSKIINSVIHSSLGWGFSMSTSMNVDFNLNIVADSQKFAVQIWKSNNFRISGNMLIGVRRRPDSESSPIWDSTTGIEMWDYIRSGSQILVKENVVQGVDGVGYIFPGSVCGEKSGFFNNSASSTIVGWLVSTNGSGCLNMSWYSGYKNEKGITEYLTVQSVKASNLILAENKEALTILHGHEGDDNKIEYSNMWIAALARPDCADCYQTVASCSNFRGMRIAVVNQAGKAIPIDSKSSPAEFVSLCTESAFEGRNYHTNIKYNNFQNSYQNHSVAAWQKCRNNRVFTTLLNSKDSSTTQILIDTDCIGCDEDGLIEFLPPQDSWIGWMGGCGNITCTGPNNLLITDISGRFLGKVGQAIPENQISKAGFCNDKPAWRGHFCEGTEYTVLTFESLASNRRDRIYIPVNITSGATFKNVLNMWAEWAWNGNLPKDERLARFWAIVLKNRYYDITFPTSLPQDMRFMLQDSTFDTDFIVIRMIYEVPNSIQVLVDGQIIQPYLLSEKVDLIGKSSICGANVFNSENRTIEFVVNRNPGCIVRVRYIDSVKVTLRLETTVEEFYQNNGVASFIDKMTAFLGIETSRLKIVNIRKGSVIVDFFIDSVAGHSDTSSSSSVNMDNYINKISEAINSNSLPLSYNVTEFSTTSFSTSSGSNSNSTSSGSNKTFVVIGNNTNSILELQTNDRKQLSDSTITGIVIGVTLPLILIVIVVTLSRKKRLPKKIEPIDTSLDYRVHSVSALPRQTFTETNREVPSPLPFKVKNKLDSKKPGSGKKNFINNDDQIYALNFDDAGGN